MASDSELVRTWKQLEAKGWRLDGNIFRRRTEECLPLYEAQMIHLFNHRLGNYRTKHQILDIYDRMQHAIATGKPYQTLLDPPPADSQVSRR